MTAAFQLSINPRKIFWFLFIVEAGILLLDMAIYFAGFIEYHRFAKLFRITSEGNLPTWYSSTQSIVVGLVAIVIGMWSRININLFSAFIWFLIGMFFIVIGIDDAAYVHESLGAYLDRNMTHIGDDIFLIGKAMSFPSYPWQIIFVPFLGLASLLMMFFFYRTFKGLDLLVLFCLGISLYVVAVGLDYVDGLHEPYNLLAESSEYSEDDWEHLFRAVEEYLEMLGTTLILTSFLLHFGRVCDGVQQCKLVFRGYK